MAANSSTRWRILAIMAILSAGALILVGQLIRWQVIEHETFLVLAEEEHQSEATIRPRRGAIYDRNGFLLAADTFQYAISASPPMISDPYTAADRLFPLLEMGRDETLTALTSDLPETSTMKAEIRARRDLVCDLLSNLPGLECLRPDAGMFVMVDVRSSGLTAFDFASRLLDEYAVSVLPADAFGPSAEGHLRIGLCTGQDQLRAACERIAAFALALRGDE